MDRDIHICVHHVQCDPLEAKLRAAPRWQKARVLFSDSRVPKMNFFGEATVILAGNKYKRDILCGQELFFGAIHESEIKK